MALKAGINWNVKGGHRLEYSQLRIRKMGSVTNEGIQQYYITKIEELQVYWWQVALLLLFYKAMWFNNSWCCLRSNRMFAVWRLNGTT